MLSEAENAELEAYVNVGDLLALCTLKRGGFWRNRRLRSPDSEERVFDPHAAQCVAVLHVLAVKH
jgi:hypothetical protein